MTYPQEQDRPKSCSYTVTFSGYRPAAAGRAGRIVQVPSTCGFPAKSQLDGAWYCARHHNTTARNKRVRAWIKHQGLTCPDHPEALIGAQTNRRRIYCPGSPGPGISHRCTWKMRVPTWVWELPKEPQGISLNA